MFQVVVARMDSASLIWRPMCAPQDPWPSVLPQAILWISLLNLVAGQSFGLACYLWLARITLTPFPSGMRYSNLSGWSLNLLRSEPQHSTGPVFAPMFAVKFRLPTGQA
ncbi:uncharacterized protein F5891DRAFT_1009717 [Suillus fuscotomentosus]|uniref:Uncharacterized protein n=1 Tax=Suillus fuscotomentosus TaxID=1912939 RepID=A0AAD4HQR0_9AGAM|nr:uncharacterized protein F5891DRAFT_1009717 [Suillus fuscotomentosus]KAG1905518.1 hypothetical protein F5891DRAFT_1009717 [Suillus fuscotomentosus]